MNKLSGRSPYIYNTQLSNEHYNYWDIPYNDYYDLALLNKATGEYFWHTPAGLWVNLAGLYAGVLGITDENVKVAPEEAWEHYLNEDILKPEYAEKVRNKSHVIPVTVTGDAPLMLYTYPFFYGDYPFTSHSALHIINGDQLISVDKSSKADDYNLFSNNCADATLRYLGALRGGIVFPSDVHLYALDSLGGHDLPVRKLDKGMIRTVIPNTSKLRKIAQSEFAKDKDDKYTAREFDISRPSFIDMYDTTIDAVRNANGVKKIGNFYVKPHGDLDELMLKKNGGNLYSPGGPLSDDDPNRVTYYTTLPYQQAVEGNKTNNIALSLSSVVLDTKPLYKGVDRYSYITNADGTVVPKTFEEWSGMANNQMNRWKLVPNYMLYDEATQADLGINFGEYYDDYLRDVEEYNNERKKEHYENSEAYKLNHPAYKQARIDMGLEPEGLGDYASGTATWLSLPAWAFNKAVEIATTPVNWFIEGLGSTPNGNVSTAYTTAQSPAYTQLQKVLSENADLTVSNVISPLMPRTYLPDDTREALEATEWGKAYLNMFDFIVANGANKAAGTVGKIPSAIDVELAKMGSTSAKARVFGRDLGKAADAWDGKTVRESSLKNPNKFYRKVTLPEISSLEELGYNVTAEDATDPKLSNYGNELRSAVAEEETPQNPDFKVEYPYQYPKENNFLGAITEEPTKAPFGMSVNDAELWKELWKELEVHAASDYLRGGNGLSLPYIGTTWKKIEYPTLPENVLKVLDSFTKTRLALNRSAEFDATYKDAIDGGYTVGNSKVFRSLNADSPNTLMVGMTFYPDGKIAVLEGEEAYALPHEVRHRLDLKIPLTEEENSILSNAYDDDFSALGENLRQDGQTYDMSKERVTTNADARIRILSGLDRVKDWDLEELNNYILNLSDDAVFRAINKANGYGRRYIKKLERENKLTPEKALQFRDAMIKVGAVALPTTIGTVLGTEQQKAYGGKIKVHINKVPNTFDEGGELNSEDITLYSSLPDQPTITGHRMPKFKRFWNKTFRSKDGWDRYMKKYYGEVDSEDDVNVEYDTPEDRQNNWNIYNNWINNTENRPSLFNPDGTYIVESPRSKEEAYKIYVDNYHKHGDGYWYNNYLYSPYFNSFQKRYGERFYGAKVEKPMGMAVEHYGVDLDYPIYNNGVLWLPASDYDAEDLDFNGSSFMYHHYKDNLPDLVVMNPENDRKLMQNSRFDINLAHELHHLNESEEPIGENLNLNTNINLGDFNYLWNPKLNDTEVAARIALVLNTHGYDSREKVLELTGEKLVDLFLSYLDLGYENNQMVELLNSMMGKNFEDYYNNWNKLAEWVKSGNVFAEGGEIPPYTPSIDNEEKDGYGEYMLRMAAARAKDWGMSVLDAYAQIMNDLSYNYKRWYNTSPLSELNAALKTGFGHYPDDAKTSLHSTASTLSAYSGYVNPYNPLGITFGNWMGNQYELSDDLINNDWNINRTLDALAFSRDKEGSNEYATYKGGVLLPEPTITPYGNTYPSDMYGINKPVYYPTLYANGGKLKVHVNKVPSNIYLKGGDIKGPVTNYSGTPPL